MLSRRRGFFRRYLLWIIMVLFVLYFTRNKISLLSSFSPGCVATKYSEERLKMEIRKEAYYRYQVLEVNRTGPGEQGEKVDLSDEDKSIIANETKTEGFSKHLNDMVSLDRSLKDNRFQVCREQTYPTNLPNASVIIIFRNELLRVILRTVHSVINRTPPMYLEEVILVDDASDRDVIKDPLDLHIQSHWPEGLVKVIRLPVRSGLIRTRLAGINAAKGEVFVVMDGHMEVSQGWIEPLLAHVQKNKRTLVSSLLGGIDASDLSYVNSYMTYQTFTWNMEFRWMNIPSGEQYDVLKPLPTYALVGCFMAMNREMFLDMGGYDTGLEIWGGENVETAIRIWMCGGRVEIIPCSWVSHTYRAGHGRPWTTNNNDYFNKNIQRIAEVWLDEYKADFYLLHPWLKPYVSEVRANISSRVALRERLGCKNFHWLLNNVIQPPMFIPTNVTTISGQLQNQAMDQNQCLDTLQLDKFRSGPAGIYPCHRLKDAGPTQLFLYTKSPGLRQEFHCLSSNDKVPGLNVTLTNQCKDVPDQVWVYNKETTQFVHGLSQLCLELVNKYVIIATCNDSTAQKWIWKTTYS